MTKRILLGIILVVNTKKLINFIFNAVEHFIHQVAYKIWH